MPLSRYALIPGANGVKKSDLFVFSSEYADLGEGWKQKNLKIFQFAHCRLFLIYINFMPPIRCHFIEEGNNPEITSLWRQHCGLGAMNSELKN